MSLSHGFIFSMKVRSSMSSKKKGVEADGRKDDLMV